MALAAVVALLLAAVGIAAIAIPRLVRTPEFSAALSERASRALGTPVAWERLDVGLFAPRVILVRPSLVGEEGAQGRGSAVLDERSAGVSADAIELHLSLWPLLQRRIAIESLLVRGLALGAARTSDGLVLPRVIERIASGDSADASREPDSSEPAFHVDLRALIVEDSSLSLVDHTLTPPLTLRLDALTLAARGRSFDEPLDVEGRAHALVDGRALGDLALRGRAALAGDYDVELELDRLVASELRPFLPSEIAVAKGVVSGRISIAGTRAKSSSENAGRLVVDLALSDLKATAREIALAGEASLRAERRRDGRIPFEATYRPPDAGKAELRGELAESGSLELTALLDAFELAPFSPLLGSERKVEGRAKGEVSFTLEPGAEPDAARRLVQASSDLVIDGARYADGRIDAKGRLDVGAAVDGPGGSAPARVQAVFEPEQGGRIDLNGTGALEGAIKAAVRFDAVDVALFAPLLPADARASGKLSGEAEIETTPDRALSTLATRLRIAGAHVVRTPVDVSGDLSLDARSEGAGPIALRARATLADGGRVAASGTSTRDGVVDLALELERFDLSALAPFVDRDDLALAGRVDGRGTLAGPYADLERLALDLDFAETRIRDGSFSVSGPFRAKLDLKKPLSSERSGTLDLDLDEAALRQADSFAKPAGVRARFATTLEADRDGRLVFSTKGALHDVNDFALDGSLGEKRSSFALTTSEFDLAGWSDLLPALSPYAPTGVASFASFSRASGGDEPDRFGGRVNLRGVEVALPGAGRVRLDGALAGAGERLELAGVRATLHGLVTGLTGSVADPFGDARFTLAVRSVGEADANPFVSGLSSLHDVVYGPLSLDASLAGVAGGEAKLYDTLSGRVRFSVGEKGGGRLRGISILQATLGQIPLLGGAARVAARLRDPADASNELAERFEILEGDLAIGEGRIEAKTLRLGYRGHEARVSGRMQLEGLGLDMTGELRLDPSVVARLSGRPASELAGRAPVRIPLAHVTRTLADPQVTLAPETLAAVPRLLLLTTGTGAIVDEAVGKVEKRIGDAFGKVGAAIGGGVGGGIGGGPTAIPRPVEQPVEEPIGKPAEGPMEKPAEGPTEKPTGTPSGSSPSPAPEPSGPPAGPPAPIGEAPPPSASGVVEPPPAADGDPDDKTRTSGTDSTNAPPVPVGSP